MAETEFSLLRPIPALIKLAFFVFFSLVLLAVAGRERMTGQYDAALRAITLTPAEMLGLASELGSIDKGKRANLVLAAGDIFEPSTRILHVFIDGREMSLDTIQTRNYEKYRPRP